MIRLYTLYGGSPTRKARRHLYEYNISYVEQNIRKKMFSYKEFLHILYFTEEGVGEILSGSKDLDPYLPHLENYTIRELYELICANPHFIKTPILVSDKIVIIGYSDEKYRSLIPREKKRELHWEILSEVHEKEEEELKHVIRKSV